MAIKLNTYADILALLESGAVEGLQLEFKEKENADTSILSRVDKRNIAKSVSSFANSDGGTLVFGVKTKKTSGGDAVHTLVPIADVETFLDFFRTVCSLNIGPDLLTLTSRAVHEGNSSAGFIVCEVARSDRRPHMSTASDTHTYYRRSFEGVVPMTPSEIRDQMLAVRDAALEPVIRVPAGGSYSNGGDWMSAQIGISFSLKNIGVALAKNPYLRVSPSSHLVSHGVRYDEQLTAWKTSFSPGIFIHVGDIQECFVLNFNVAIDYICLRNLFAAQSADLTSSVIVMPGQLDYQVKTISDKISLQEIGFNIQFGAENAPLSTQNVVHSRSRLAKSVLSASHVRERYTQVVGAFRTDLLEKFLSSEAV